MSDIEIVSADAFRNGELEDGRVPYGTIFADETDQSDQHSFEGLQDDAVAAVDWRGVDQVDRAPGPKKPAKKTTARKAPKSVGDN